MNNFFGGGEGLLSTAFGNCGAEHGGFGARFGFPWLLVVRSDRSDVDRLALGAGLGGAAVRHDILPPNTVPVPPCKALLFLDSVVTTCDGNDCSEGSRGVIDPVVITLSELLKCMLFLIECGG